MRINFNFTTIAVTLVLCVFVSCSTEVKIDYPLNFLDDNELKINGIVVDPSTSPNQKYRGVFTKNGKVEISINGEIKTIQTEKGGFLNLNEEELVVFPIYYGNNNFSFTRPHSIVVDSILYYKHVMADKDEDYYISNFMNNGQLPYDKISHMEFSVISKSDFFAERNWEIDIDEEIPDKMEVSYNQQTQYVSGGSQRILRPAEYFKVHAQLTNEYKSVDLKKE